MMQKLQRKFVMIAMGSLLVILLIIIGTINGINLYQLSQKADSLLIILSENGGRFPKMEKRPPHLPRPDLEFNMTEETPFETRYFWVKADEGGVIVQIDTGHIAAVSSAQAQEYGQIILDSSKAKGFHGSYKYLKSTQTDGTLVVFIDTSSQLATALSFLLISCGVAVISLLVMLILVSVLSKKAIRPMLESMEKQKQFITDAGHEIKTPLAIISANTDVLEIESGGNEWVKSIRNQTKRLGELVENMLTLSKMDEDKIELVFSDFSMSDAVYNTAEAFETIAQSQGKQFEMNIQPKLVLHGDENGIRQLVSILLDNALKYTSEQGEVKIEFTSDDKAVRLEVSNSCDALPEGDLSRLFDRFYRADASRNHQSGGYGIGLSVAKAIVNAHKGRIFAESSKTNWICFVVILNREQ